MTTAGAETLTYDLANGLLTGTTLGVVTDSLTYNGFAEVDSYTANVNASTVFSNSFVRDKLGRITQKTETVQGVTHVYDYTYDTAGRLTDVDRDSLPFASYTYDSNGNRLNNGAIFDDQDRQLSQGTATYTYTANGELLTKNDGGQTTYNYDVLGNLISVTLPGGTLIEYIIDGRNRRVGKKVNGTLERAWLYKDGLNPVAELDGTGTVVSRFVYAMRANVPDFIIKGGNTYRVISDLLGSPRLVVDTATGAVVQTMDFDEWGNVTADTNPEFQPFGFAGGLYDTDTKLVRFGARDYDAEMPSWTVKDPIGFNGGDTNLFRYTLNDPINFFDPFGLAYFAYRAFGGTPEWISRGPGTNPVDDGLNTELVHEHIFFEDGESPTNLGFMGDNGAWNQPGVVRPDDPQNLEKYWRKDNKRYDDDLMREAVKKVGAGNYCLLGSNCQDWADKVRVEYERLNNLRNNKCQ